MNQRRDPDAIIAMWLEDGPIALPDETRRAISVGLRTQPRARQMAILRGLPIMIPITRLATAAAIVLAVGAVSILALSNRGGGPGGVASPSVAPSSSAVVSTMPSPSVTASPAPLSTAGWIPFASTRYGYAIAYP